MKFLSKLYTNDSLKSVVGSHQQYPSLSRPEVYKFEFTEIDVQVIHDLLEYSY
jgi:hypothetical protein